MIPSLEQLGIDFYSVKHNLFSWRKMLQFIRKFDPGVIHAVGGALALESAARISRAIDAPLIHTLHSLLPEDRQETYPPQVRGIVAVNQGLREYLVNAINYPKKQIKVIPYGLDVTTAKPRSTPADNGVKIVGTIGRLGKGRRHDEFIAAAREVVDQFPDVHFIVAGEGPNEIPLRKQVKKLKLSEHVTFVSPSTDVFSVVDLLVFVSDWGGVGLNLLEAMKNQCPVIATGGGEVFSILDSEDICEIVPPGDQARLSSAIIDLLRDPDRRSKLAENGFAYVKLNYSLSAHLLALDEFYGQITSRSVETIKPSKSP